MSMRKSFATLWPLSNNTPHFLHPSNLWIFSAPLAIRFPIAKICTRCRGIPQRALTGWGLHEIRLKISAPLPWRPWNLCHFYPDPYHWTVPLIKGTVLREYRWVEFGNHLFVFLSSSIAKFVYQSLKINCKKLFRNLKKKEWHVPLGLAGKGSRECCKMMGVIHFKGCIMKPRVQTTV